jgi:Tfp pilus assembly protein PilF
MWLKRNKKFLESALENPGLCLLHVEDENQEHSQIAKALLKLPQQSLDSVFEKIFLKTP